MHYQLALKMEPFEFTGKYGLRQRHAFPEYDLETGLFSNDMEYPVGEVGGNGRDYIRWVQQSLNKALGLNLATDGIMGPQTRSAIRSFQQRYGLATDGIVGPATERALVTAGAGKPTAVPMPSPSYQPVKTGYFKDSPILQNTEVRPRVEIMISSQWPAIRKKLASTFNRIGGLARALADEVKIDVQSVLSVWVVESGGLIHNPGQAIIRFENHLFYREWGKYNESVYNKYFRHGGNMGHPGKPWENHEFRESESDQFKSFHGKQAAEYKVLSFASKLGGDAALRSISIGGPQILVSNYSMIGYPSPKAMYDAFQGSERAHVLGFFDFCNQKPAPQKGNMINYLRERRWSDFARYYNGPGQVETYGRLIQNNYNEALQLSIV